MSVPGYATDKKATSGTKVLLRRLGPFPTVLPLAVLLGALNAAAASFEFFGWSCGDANDHGGQDDDVGELHFGWWGRLSMILDRKMSGLIEWLNVCCCLLRVLVIRRGIAAIFIPCAAVDPSHDL